VIGTCGSAGCIDASSVAAIFSIVMGLWATGFAMGKAVAWARAISAAA
jgi:hypothetical protein